MSFTAELTHPKYWVHLGLIATIVLGILQYLQGGNMFTLHNILYSIPLLALADITAHTLLRLN